jgi:hypothetical protein
MFEELLEAVRCHNRQLNETGVTPETIAELGRLTLYKQIDAAAVAARTFTSDASYLTTELDRTGRALVRPATIIAWMELVAKDAEELLKLVQTVKEEIYARNTNWPK